MHEFENRAGKVLGPDGREMGTVFLEEEEVHKRRVARWWGLFSGWTVEPAIHLHYWACDGSFYEDAIIDAEGVSGSLDRWRASQVEVMGEVHPVRWATAAESEEVRAWLRVDPPDQARHHGPQRDAGA